MKIFLWAIIALSFLSAPTWGQTATPFVLRFDVGKAVLDWNTPHNTQQQQALDRTITKTLPQVDTIYVTSGMSPEGTDRINILLAVGRSTVVRDHLARTYGIDPARIQIDANWNMWQTMLDAIEADPKMPQKEKVLEVLDTPCSTQGAMSQTLRNLDARLPEAYAYLKKTIFPALRIATIQIKLK